MTFARPVGVTYGLERLECSSAKDGIYDLDWSADVLLRPSPSGGEEF
jgi:hypothetical protein